MYLSWLVQLIFTYKYRRRVEIHRVAVWILTVEIMEPFHYTAAPMYSPCADTDSKLSGVIFDGRGIVR